MATCPPRDEVAPGGSLTPEATDDLRASAGEENAALVWEGAAHLKSLERSDELLALLEEWLACQ